MEEAMAGMSSQELLSSKPKTLEDVQELFKDGEQADKEIFAEQRVNLRLVKGDHFSKKQREFWTRIREARGLSKDRKLRLVKNHSSVVSRKLVNAYLTYSPGVTIVPKNEAELGDQKSAELNRSVWEDIKHRQNFSMLKRRVTKDFVDIGEVWGVIKWNPTAGRHRGWQEEMDPQTGMPLLDEAGAPIIRDLGYTGDFDIDLVLGCNVVRDPLGKSFEDCGWVSIQKLVSTKALRRQFKDTEAMGFIEDDSQSHEAMNVFDANTASYSNMRGRTLVREMYFRPGGEYPNGWFVIFTDLGILHQGELPFGLFPVINAGYDESQTTPRSAAIFRQLRPIQIEINRCYSKIAETQMTLGNMVFVKKGDQLTSSPMGGSDTRVYHYNQDLPQVSAGQSGHQYLSLLEHNIAEFYRVAGTEEEENHDKQINVDQYAMLYRSMRYKKKHSVYIEKLEQFYKQMCELMLELARHYYPDDMVVPAIGKNEAINIAEFRSADPLRHRIKVEPVAEDSESMLGKQIAIHQLLQYSGKQLSTEQLGLMIRAMPFANEEMLTSELTTDFDNARNDMLALDRGDFSVVQPDNDENHEYMIKALTRRIKQPDFKSLHPQIQQAYMQKRMLHQQIKAQQAAQIAQAQSGFVPIDAQLVGVDMYIQPKETNEDGTPKAQKRLRIPAASIRWLLEKLEQQKFFAEEMADYEQGDQANIAQMMSVQAGAPQPGMPPQMQLPIAAS